uniref:Transmembrane anti-sigma factor n=1 Tax=Rhodopseudomonas palustris (strain BisA53) TaxID=316055 RepID=Q07QJ5_RHOP5
MMATSKKIQEQEPGAIEALLPWHAAGTLNAQDKRLVDDALLRDPDLARQYAVIQDECAAAIQLNESLGAPSPRALEKLLASIDAEPTYGRAGSTSWFTGLFAALSPRTLAWSAVAAAAVLLLQAGAIGSLLLQQGPGAPFQTADDRSPPSPGIAPRVAPPPMAAPAPRPTESQTQRMAEAPALRSEPITRSLAPEPAPRALVRFTPDARVSDIITLLDAYQAKIVESTQGGLFRLQFGDRPLPRPDLDRLLARLQAEEIVSQAGVAP